MDAHEAEPGSLVQEPDSKPIERRDPRLRCKGTAEICVLPAGTKSTGTLADLSVRGCCIVADRAIPAKADDRIEVCFRVNGFALRLAGIVRHVQGGTRAGIEFTDLCCRKEEQIKELVSELFDREEELGVSEEPDDVPGVMKRSAS
jgi:hypothetical protein